MSNRKGIKREIGHTETRVKPPDLWKLKESFPKFHRDVKGEGANRKLCKWSDSEDIARLDHRASRRASVGALILFQERGG